MAKVTVYRDILPTVLRDVVAIVDSRVSPFELGVVCEVFGVDRSADGLPCLDFAVCLARPGPASTAGGMTITSQHSLERTATADLLVIPGWRTDAEPPPPPDVVDALHAAIQRGATVLSICTGAFLLAAAGLLGGRRVTCHWFHTADLAARYPHIALDEDRLYIQDGPIITSAGTAAGIDACLYVVRRELGAAVANGIARRMVVPPHRDGGQAQFVESPVPRCRCSDTDMASLLEWLQGHLHEAHSIATLAARLHLSPRTFARRFAAGTGTAPHQWLTRQRVLLAQQLLEEDSLDVEEIARRCGFGTGESLRHHFARHVGTTPTNYRRTFSHQLAPA